MWQPSYSKGVPGAVFNAGAGTLQAQTRETPDLSKSKRDRKKSATATDNKRSVLKRRDHEIYARTPLGVVQVASFRAQLGGRRSTTPTEGVVASSSSSSLHRTFPLISDRIDLVPVQRATHIRSNSSCGLRAAIGLLHSSLSARNFAHQRYPAHSYLAIKIIAKDVLRLFRETLSMSRVPLCHQRGVACQL